MKYINKILSIGIMLGLCYSCSTLEEDTSSLLTVGNIESEADLGSNLSPIYRTLMSLYSTPHQLRITTYGSDDITTWSAGNKASLRVFDKFDYGSGENSDGLWQDVPWNTYWEIIYFSNSLLDGIKIATGSEALLKSADAEARVFRALAYLGLVKRYGNVPLILDGVIPTGKEQRATVLENYYQIESDLLIAEQYLPAPGSEVQGRATAAFAKSVLADLYLTWAGWPVKDAAKYPLAAAKAKEVIDYNYFMLLPFVELWALEGGASMETIFSLRYDDGRTIYGNNAAAFSFHQAKGFSDCFPELQFFYDFPEGARKNYTFTLDIPKRAIVNGVIVPSDPATTPWQKSDRKHPMFKKHLLSVDLAYSMNNRVHTFRPIDLYRYAEILLIYAEAQARGQGGNASSLEALNQVKRRAAGLPYLIADGSVDVSSATPSEIVDEKGWELAAENKRWFDLVRTERLAEMAAKRDPTEPVSLTKLPTEAQYIAPIPATAINLSDLIQNPEGFKIQ
jgi:hypothetical protein